MDQRPITSRLGVVALLAGIALIAGAGQASAMEFNEEACLDMSNIDRNTAYGEHFYVEVPVVRWKGCPVWVELWKP